MIPKTAKMRSLFVGAAALVLAAVAFPQGSYAANSSIKAIVNGTVITQGDVARRVNFLRLRGSKGNLQKLAQEELVNEALMRAEIIRTGNSVSTDDVDSAYRRFAQNNKMSVEQLSTIMEKAGVGVDHFKAYIGISLSWPRVVQARFGGQGMSNADFVARLRADQGKKPVTTEYILQQVIFVVPQSKRNQITGKRKSEAEASRKRYPGCDQAKAFAATMRDVSIRNIGRILEPQLPEDWKAMVTKTEVGGTTGTRVTEKGVEYLAVCMKRQVSDDFAAQVAYQAQDLEKAEKEGAAPESKKLLDELRKKAAIEIR